MQKIAAALNEVVGNNNGAWIMVNQTGICPYPVRIAQAAQGFQESRPISVMGQNIPQKQLRRKC